MPATPTALLLAAAALFPQSSAPPKPAPEAPTASGAGTLVVLNKSAATADLVDVATGKVTRTLPTGDGPHEGITSPDGRLVVVADYGAREAGNTLTVIDTQRGEVLAPIDLGEHTRPHGLAFAGELLLVTCEGKRALVGVDLEQRKVVRTCDTGQEISHMVATAPDGARAFVANIGSGSVTAIDLATWTVVKSVPTGAQAEGISVAPDGREVWVTNRQAGTVTVLDAATLAVLAELECPGFPIRVEHTPDGTLALVSCPNESDVAVFDAPARTLKARVPLELDLAEGAEEGLFGKRFGTSAIPIGILVPPGGRVAYVACAAANRVAVLDLASLAVTRTFAVGAEPDGLAWVPPRG
jgi:YVTN family beta-propeller protein